MAWHSAEYKRYLKSSEWAERKRQYYAIHHRRCSACGTYKKIHPASQHSSYERLTREPDSDLWPLCFNCHRHVHRANETGRFRDLEAATIFIVERSQARQRRHRQFRRLMSRLVTRRAYRRSRV